MAARHGDALNNPGAQQLPRIRKPLTVEEVLLTWRTMGQPPVNYATRCDEAATVHTTPAAPRAGAEVDEEVESGETAAAAATNGTSDTRRKARGKRKGGQQRRLSGCARKRYKKNLDNT